MGANLPDELGLKYKRWGTTQLCHALKNRRSEYATEEVECMQEVMRNRVKKFSDDEIAAALGAPRTPDDFNELLREELRKRGLAQVGESTDQLGASKASAESVKDDEVRGKSWPERVVDGKSFPPPENETEKGFGVSFALVVLALVFCHWYWRAVARKNQTLRHHL